MTEPVNETFGVYLTPRLEKYQNSNAAETVEIQQWTWNFGNELKGQGYTVAYMHGPVCLYEGTLLTALIFDFKLNNQLKEFIDSNSLLKECVIFLFQKLPEQLRYAVLEKSIILENRKKLFKKVKKRLDKQD
jgi:hypothetical protein